MSNIQPHQITRADAEQIALRGLQSFFNVNWLAELLADKHKVTAKDRHFVKMQAESIKYCLQQALEYRSAALTSSFSRPTLVYYSMMSFALCEVLFKGNGDYRLQKLREKNAHHGLDFAVRAPNKFRGDVSIDDLSAKPLQKGTFAIWHKMSRQVGIFGEYIEIAGGGQTTKMRQIGSAGPLELLPKSLGLRDLAQNCAAIYWQSGDMGLSSRLVRATLQSTSNNNNRTHSLKVIFHPTGPDLLNQVCEKVTFSPRCADLVVPMDFQNGAGFSLNYPSSADYIQAKLPPGFAIYQRETLFSADDLQLNEFGIFYVASYIAGMFARYYPEYWARSLESGNQTYQIIDSIMSAALNRAPLLLLGEFRDRCYIYE